MENIANPNENAVPLELDFVQTTLESAAIFLIGARVASPNDKRKLCDAAERALRVSEEHLPRIYEDEERRDAGATIAQLTLSLEELRLVA